MKWHMQNGHVEAYHSHLWDWTVELEHRLACRDATPQEEDDLLYEQYATFETLEIVNACVCRDRHVATLSPSEAFGIPR